VDLRQRLVGTFVVAFQEEEVVTTGEGLADRALAEFVTWLNDQAGRYQGTGHHPQTAQVFRTMALLVDTERG
jgi:hypothetical protein